MKSRIFALWGVLLPVLAGCGSEASVPGAPAWAAAQAADGQALVRWAPPGKDGGSAIRDYVVRCEPACGGALVSSGERHATVRGLNNGVPYVIRVAAMNLKGEGPETVAAEAVMPQAGAEFPDPTVPGAPRAVRATPGNGQVYLSWLEPASHGGRRVLNYRVTAHPGGASVTVDAPAASVSLPGLVNGQAYSFTVVATNERGDGPPELAAAVTPRSGGEPALWVSGYYVGYQRALLPVEAVDFSGMTHIIAGRFKPRPDGTVNPDMDVTEYEGRELARRLAERAHQSGRKAMMLLGGFGEHDNFVAATSAESRPVFVRSLLTLMDELGYDGIDVDWEPINLPPVGNDGEALLALLDELRAARPDILLSVPVNWVNANFGIPGHEAAFMRELAARADHLNLMSYRMSGHWPTWESWHSSALRDEAPGRPSSISSSVDAYLKAGIPPERLGVGIGFYGTCWRGVTEPRTPIDGRGDIREVGSDNALSYTNIMTDYYEPEAYRWDARAQVPYLSLPARSGPGQCNYISYEDEASLAAKGRYVRHKGLGGAIIWTLNQGHLPQAPEGRRQPLLQAVKSAFLDP